MASSPPTNERSPVQASSPSLDSYCARSLAYRRHTHLARRLAFISFRAWRPRNSAAATTGATPLATPSVFEMLANYVASIKRTTSKPLEPGSEYMSLNGVDRWL